MNADQWSSLVFFTIVIYFVGCINWGWTSPKDMWKDIAATRRGHRDSEEQNPRSEDDIEEDDPKMSSMSGHPLKEPLRQPQSLNSSPRYGGHGAHEFKEITHVDRPETSHVSVKFNEKSVRRQKNETGIAWTRRMLSQDLLIKTEIYRAGSKEFGVTERQVRRWIQKIEGPKPRKDHDTDTDNDDDDDDDE